MTCVGQSGIAEEMTSLDLLFLGLFKLCQEYKLSTPLGYCGGCLQRGETKFYWKQRHSDKNVKSGEFLTKKSRDHFNKIHQKSSGPRGVNSVKLDHKI